MSYDDWYAETQTRLAKSAIYLTLKDKCKDDAAGHHVLELVDEATVYAIQCLQLDSE